jgi:hypothetical protein
VIPSLHSPPHSFLLTIVDELSALANLAVISSCDLLRYEGGSIGIFRYADEMTGECTNFVSLDDQPLMAARSASMAAFILGSCFTTLSLIHNFVWKVPEKDILSSLLGTAIQLCLIVVYGAKENGVCEVEGCYWGRGAIWHVLSQILYLASFGGTLYTSNLRKYLSVWRAKQVGKDSRRGHARTATTVTLQSEYDSA